MTATIRAWLDRLGRWLARPSFQEHLEHELRNGDAVSLRVSTFERSLGRSDRFPAGSESPAAVRTNLNRG